MTFILFLLSLGFGITLGMNYGDYGLYPTIVTVIVVWFALMVLYLLLGRGETIDRVKVVILNILIFTSSFTFMKWVKQYSNSPTEVARREYYQKMSKASKDLSPIHQQKGEKLEVLILSYREIPVRAQYAPVALRAMTKEGKKILVFLDNESARCSIHGIVPGNYLPVMKVSIDGQEMYFAYACPSEPRSF